MRLQLLSDLHFEFHRDGGRSFVDSLDPTGIDVLVLAGDIAVAEGIPPALALLCGRFRDASVVYVHGNHEFYGSDRNSVLDITKRAQAENPNLAWLDNLGAQLNGFNFLGAPLWFPRSTVDESLKHAMNDFSVIEDFESWVYEENARAVAFFERQLHAGDIVVTHHLPSQRCVAPRFAGHSLNPFFVCDLTRLIMERRPRLWLHGHSHASVNTQIGETTVLCNPFGYALTEPNHEFLDRLVVELEMTTPQARNPLHGITLDMIVTELVAHFGWSELGQQVNIRCFTSDPSVGSSLKFLRRTPWARAKVESLYLFMLRERARRARRESS